MAYRFLITSATQLVTRDDSDWDETGENNGSPGCTTAIPGPNGHVPLDACNSYYNYDPQYAPAVAVAVLLEFSPPRIS